MERSGSTSNEIRVPWHWLTSPADHHRRYAASGAWLGRTVGQLARDRAAREPGATVFLDSPAPATYASLVDDAEALAAALIDLGLAVGDVIAFQTPNWHEAAIINLAAALGGFVINPIVPIYRDAEVRQMLADCGAKAFFHAETFRSYDFSAMVERIRGDLPALRHVVPVRAGTLWDRLLSAGRGPGGAAAASRSAQRKDGALHVRHHRAAQRGAAQPRHARPRGHRLRAALEHSRGRRDPHALPGHACQRLCERPGTAFPNGHAHRADGELEGRRGAGADRTA